MHEMSIAIQMLDQVTALAAEHAATRVAEIEVVAGAMRQVVPEALELAFAAAAQGTVAAGAELRIVEEPMRAACRDCGCAFAAEIDNYLCPQCGRANARIVAGNDIILKSVVCETPESVSS
jgi:hydrogenase nickel incorporation protein HypA/HybF